MSVITISVIESPVQKVAGIPVSIELDTNVPATIFYTLDGTEPTATSDIAIGSIELPTTSPSVVVRAIATNGVDTSPQVSFGYGPNWGSLRYPHAKVIKLPNGYTCVFTGAKNVPAVKYDQPAGITVDLLSVNGVPDGYDGTATKTFANETDLEYNRTNYNTIYSTTNSKGESGSGIGTLPGNVTFVVPDPINKSNDANSKLFNPKSVVIIQDGREDDGDKPPILNRQFFSLGRPERTRDGIKFRNTGLDGSVATGSFLRPQYNPKDNTYIFYYRDAETNNWIISIEPLLHNSNSGAIQQMVFPPSSRGEKKIFRWIPFKRQILR